MSRAGASTDATSSSERLVTPWLSYGEDQQRRAGASVRNVLGSAYEGMLEHDFLSRVGSSHKQRALPGKDSPAPGRLTSFGFGPRSDATPMPCDGSGSQLLSAGSPSGYTDPAGRGAHR